MDINVGKPLALLPKYLSRAKVRSWRNGSGPELVPPMVLSRAPAGRIFE